MKKMEMDEVEGKQLLKYDQNRRKGMREAKRQLLKT